MQIRKCKSENTNANQKTEMQILKRKSENANTSQKNTNADQKIQQH